MSANQESFRLKFGRWIAGVQKRAYAQGAVVDRLSTDWRLSSVSPNQETRGDIRELRRRARALHRDDPYVNGMVREYAQNIIGEDGLALHPRNAGASGQLSDKANANIKAAWQDWSHPENASVDGQQSWVELQKQIVESFFVDGEVFVRQHTFPNAYGYALELIDPDLLDEQYNRAAGTNGGKVVNQIAMGVEIDKWSRPVFYHFWSHHPSEPGPRMRQAVPAAEIIHLWKRKRIGQTRGVTGLAPIIFRLKMLGAYEDAEVTAARIASSKMGFFQTDTTNLDAWEPPQPTEKILVDVSPGSMETLPPGMSFKEWNPQHPTTAFKDFVKAVLRSIAVGAGMAYTSLTGDLEAVNYSSIRAGLLSERDMYRAFQKYFAEHLHRIVYRSWIETAVLSPSLSLPSRIAERWLDVEFKGRGWKWVDPYNEMRAIEMAVALGLKSRTQACYEMGVDFEDILQDLKREKDLADKYGVDIEGVAAKKDTPQPIPDAGGPDNAGADEADASKAGAGRGAWDSDGSGARKEMLEELRHNRRLAPFVSVARMAPK